MKQKNCYKQGVVKKTINDNLKKGEIVDILLEKNDFYLIRKYTTSDIQKIKKEDLLIN